jgi:sulfur carrier protein ThiS
MTAYDRSITAASSRSAETITVEVRFVTSLTKFSDSPRFAEKIEVPAETTVGDLIAIYGIPVDQIARVLCNGRDMNPGTYTGGNLDLGASISDGDVITFSGPAPAIPGTRSAAV